MNLVCIVQRQILFLAHKRQPVFLQGLITILRHFTLEKAHSGPALSQPMFVFLLLSEQEARDHPRSWAQWGVCARLTAASPKCSTHFKKVMQNNYLFHTLEWVKLAVQLKKKKKKVYLESAKISPSQQSCKQIRIYSASHEGRGRVAAGFSSHFRCREEKSQPASISAPASRIFCSF